MIHSERKGRNKRKKKESWRVTRSCEKGGGMEGMLTDSRVKVLQNERKKEHSVKKISILRFDCGLCNISQRSMSMLSPTLL